MDNLEDATQKEIQIEMTHESDSIPYEIDENKMPTENHENNIPAENNENDPSKVKHIVISGGGPAGFAFYGTLRESHKKKMWSLENLETLYGISIGSILITFICLDYEWEVLDDFIIKRPWHEIFKFNILSITSSFQNKGIFSIQIIKSLFDSLLKGKDLSVDITLKEFYEFSKKEIHIFATEIHSYKIIDFSYKTHPDWKLIDVIYCSCAIPAIFMPYLIDDKCFCDGGVISNYPLSQCLENGADPDTVFGIKMTIDQTTSMTINNDSSIFDYVICILNKILVRRLLPEHLNSPKILYEISVKYPQLSIMNAYRVLSSQEEREKLIQYGATIPLL